MTSFTFCTKIEKRIKNYWSMDFWINGLSLQYDNQIMMVSILQKKELLLLLLCVIFGFFSQTS